MTGLLRSELTKILTTRLWWGLLIGAAVFTGIQAAATAAFVGMDAGVGAPELSTGDAGTYRTIYAGSAFAGAYIFALVIGVTGMTAEHRYQTATPTFLADPHRGRVVAAKALSHMGVGAVYGLVSLVVAVVAAVVVLVVRDEPLGLGSEGMARAMALAVLAVALWTLLGLGIGTLIRNQVAAILTAVAVAFLVEPIAGVLLTALDLDDVAKFLPSTASTAMTSAGGAIGELLPWWGGGLVMVGYAAVFTALGVLLTVRRDVT